MVEDTDPVAPAHPVPRAAWATLRQWSAEGGFRTALCDERDDDTAALPALDDQSPERVAALHRFDRASGGNTAILVERLTRAGLLQASDGPRAPHGYFRGWRVIGSGTPIDGGVYLGRKPREAIVVDMRRPGSKLLSLFDTWLTLLRGDRDAESVRADLRERLSTHIASLVAAHMPYSEAVVYRLERRGVLRPDEPVDLELFLAESGGVCRHQVCLVGALLERLVQQRWLEGKVSLERKFVSGWFSHAWVRFEEATGQVWVLDPAQQRYERYEALDDAAKLLYCAISAPAPAR